MPTLTAVIEATTREHLGSGATERDLEAYCEALTRAWPVDEGEELDDDAARELAESVLEGGREGRDEEGRTWVQVGRARSAEAIARELREIVVSETIQAFISDASGHDSLRQYESLVRTRLGGSYDAEAWDDAMEVLREADVEADGEPDRLQSSLEAAAEALNEERRQPAPPPPGYFEG